MSGALRVTGVTQQIDVADLARARGFYDALFGAEPSIIVDDDTVEYEVQAGFWVQVTVQDPPRGAQRCRFGVADIVEAHAALLALGVDVTPVDTVPEFVSWCDFTDPDGNPLGLYQDLS
ncbi:VOC family protein [Microbacteriaceae bacterium VKM Ac-2855]|nr:VOC family protein [Microbacteriaceae bacterium VKM Ac-2855]